MRNVRSQSQIRQEASCKNEIMLRRDGPLRNHWCAWAMVQVREGRLSPSSPLPQRHNCFPTVQSRGGSNKPWQTYKMVCGCACLLAWGSLKVDLNLPGCFLVSSNGTNVALPRPGPLKLSGSLRSSHTFAIWEGVTYKSCREATSILQEPYQGKCAFC